MELVPPAQVIKDTSPCGLWRELAPGQMWINALKKERALKFLCLNGSIGVQRRFFYGNTSAHGGGNADLLNVGALR